ncbi:SMAD/FHA domain-containing protein [Amylostereum chailletii]|nr:SMAD/FHA domain-containing protein [Amylostereum chailletii]
MSRRSHSPRRNLDEDRYDSRRRRDHERDDDYKRGGGPRSGGRREREGERVREVGRDRNRDRHEENQRGQERDRNGVRDDGDRRRRDEDRNYDRRDQPREQDRVRDHNRRNYDQRDRDRRRSASPRSRHHSSRPRSRSQAGSAPPDEDEKEKDKAKPNFGASGLLAAETNLVRKTDGSSTLLKYNEPPEARKPVIGWRLYVFKGKEQVDLMHIARQSAYLIGRDRAVADIAIEHPSCSKQHAVIQFRQVTEKDEFGGSKPVIKPFVIDLESTNGTHVNDETIPTTRFYELKLNDVLKFGQSTREYVLLHDAVA